MTKSKFTNLSTNISHEDEVTRNKFPNVSTFTNWKTSSGIKVKFSKMEHQNTTEMNEFQNTTLDKMFKNNIVAHRSTVRTSGHKRRGMHKNYNKSVHWSSNYQSKTILDESIIHHQKRKSIGPYETTPNLIAAGNTEKFGTFSGPQFGSISITPEVVTRWIKDTLEDATYFQVPGTIKNADRRNILRAYGVDKETLSVEGVPESSISRLYKWMFIYSVGFNELLKTILGHSKNKTGLITSIWKVFAILMEYWWKIDYQALVNQLWDKHKEEIKELDKSYDDKIKEMSEEIKELHEKIEEQKQTFEILEKEKKEEVDKRMMAEQQ
jgi:hypothetical protein